ncbi:MAG: sigma 54-interacting transcriptional regulator [Myxococcales bacterium]|nr:sigma 54-interacting transcriptional regulator [Myxococcales bacterium]
MRRAVDDLGVGDARHPVGRRADVGEQLPGAIGGAGDLDRCLEHAGTIRHRACRRPGRAPLAVPPLRRYDRGAMSVTGDHGADTPSLASGGGRVDDYLLCIDGERSWKVPVPVGTELTIGREADGGLRLTDALASRHHARCLATPDGLRLVDLGSRHGTLVNGERIVGNRLLRSGDVVSIGNATLVLHRTLRPVTSAVVERDALVRRLDDELARARHYGREVTVVVARSQPAADAARVSLAVSGLLPPVAFIAPLAAHHVAVVVPELGGAQAPRLAARLATALHGVLGPVTIGVARAPGDAVVADGLLAAARAAADAGELGAVTDAAAHVPTIEIGDLRIVVAEPSLIKLYELAARLARSPLPILIEGETGVGKEVAAAAIHGYSRRPGPLVAVNCAAVPEALAESEWFGHARGAFTGASNAKAGYFEQAHGGSLFLDEIGELPLALQAKLLRVLEVGEIVRIGETATRRVDVRIVAATNRDLADEVRAGRFRQDLYFRIGAARLVLPPLRDRPRDLAVLCNRMLRDACAALGRTPLALSVAATWALFGYAWPGNVRELKNVIGYLAAAAGDDDTQLDVEHLPSLVTTAPRPAAPLPTAPPAAAAVPAPAAAPAVVAAPLAAAAPGASAPLGSIADDVRALERGRMVAALRSSGGQVNRAAALIAMPLRTFATKVKRYQITAADWRDPEA